MEIPTNEEVETYILASLPETFAGLNYRSPAGCQDSPWYRAIDKALQRLRKRGAIRFERSGRNVVWSKVVEAGQ